MSGSVQLKSFISHSSGLFFFLKLIKADFSDTAEVADSVAAEDKSENLRNPIVQFLTICQVRKVPALGTTA